MGRARACCVGSGAPVEGVSALIKFANDFGPWAVIAAIMVWDKWCERKATRQRETDQREREREADELARDRIATDVSLARAMADLAAEVRGMKR